MWIWRPASARLPLLESGQAEGPFPSPQALISSLNPVRTVPGTARSGNRAVRSSRSSMALLTRRPIQWLLGLLLLFGAAPLITVAAGGRQEAGPASAGTPPAGGQGWKALERGRYQESIRLFAEATRRHPNDPMMWVGLALSERGLQQDQRAIRSLATAIERAPQMTQAHHLLARLHAERDEPGAAIGHYEEALGQDPNNVRLQSEYRQVRGAMREEQGFSRVAGRHVVVKFAEPSDQDRGSRLAAHLEEVCDAIARELGSVPATPVVALLHSHKSASEPVWAAGIFDGRIHVTRTQLDAGGSRFQTYLRHECTHALTHRLSQGRAPTWLDEGLAQYLERPVTERSEGLPVHGEEGPILLESLRGDFVGLPRAEAERKYADSLRAVQVMIARHGLSGVRRWLEAIAVSKDLAQAYQHVFHTGYPMVVTR
ncbi:MAG: tetratricopeptide repeat protein [Nitrospira sp.]|nr:MAG: tetratricopeptide repeat protein [Nitrospira sp.]